MLFYLMFCWFVPSLAQFWMNLALSSSELTTKKPLCDNYQFFTETQRRLCYKYTELIPEVAEGAVLSYEECRHQFRWERWSCVANKNRTRNQPIASLFGKSLALDSKEAAFVNALFSAGVAYAITKACSSNMMASCSCQQSRSANKWGMCSDNVEFGLNFAEQFIDSTEKNWNLAKLYTRHDRSMMNLQNNRAGRAAVAESLWQKCICHGVSGSCATKICSKVVADFRHIGTLLKSRVNDAVQVSVKFVGRNVLLPVKKHVAPVSVNQLVYLKPSPLYCDVVPGRRCRLKAGRGSCAQMCCGRGYMTKERVVEKDCRCKFLWCCKVECQKCRYKQKVHICK